MTIRIMEGTRCIYLTLPLVKGLSDLPDTIVSGRASGLTSASNERSYLANGVLILSAILRFTTQPWPPSTLCGHGGSASHSCYALNHTSSAKQDRGSREMPWGSVDTMSRTAAFIYLALNYNETDFKIGNRLISLTQSCIT